MNHEMVLRLPWLNKTKQKS